MVDVADGLLAAQVGALVVGLAIAAGSDWRTREVSDRLWQALGAIGLVLGALVLLPDGAVPVVLWIVVAALAFEHMVSWDLFLGPKLEGYADLIEVAAYVVVIAVVASAAVRVGLGSDGVPYAAVACLATILFSRGLFELGVLYGGGDAKALMIAGVLVPTFATPWLFHPGSLALVTSVLPFSIDLLLDAAILSIGIPIGLALRNASRGELHGVAGFTGYEIPVSELPNRFVWVRDPSYGSVRQQEEAIETSEDDRRRRAEIAEELRAKGVDRVWVTPQIPFLVLMAAGAVLALLAGNLVLDLVAVL